MSDCPGCGSHQLQNCLPGCDGETRHPRIDWKARAERAEALLREAQTEMDAGGYWASQVWRAKVRALLEGKT